MDWTTFIKDNSQALFTLGGVLLGSAITFLGNYLNNRFQARENDKQRIEIRRNAKNQLALELARADVTLIEASIDSMLKTLDVYEDLVAKKKFGRLSDAEMKDEALSLLFDKDSKVLQLSDAMSVAEKLAFTLGDVFSREYNELEAYV